MGMTATQFLGAFNDNLFKQLILLMLVAVPVATRGTFDLQPVAMGVFSLPFILFSGLAGYLSDRHSKRNVIVLCKIAEIAVMAVGIAAFAAFSGLGPGTGLVALLVVLFLMGTQSAFFGPGKYGILPELFRAGDLSPANGVIIMTTFLAIILGTASAGLLLVLFHDGFWMACCTCILIAFLGTLTSLAIRRVAPARPGLRFRFSSLVVSGDTWNMLRRDRSLLGALLASSIFWMTGSLVQMGVNAFGTRQLNIDKLWTSVLVAGMGVGIATGCSVAGVVSKGRVNFSHLKKGSRGIVACLVVLATAQLGHVQILGYWSCLVVLFVLGVFAGVFSVPLQVFLQAKPPEGLKGRMIATQNLINWVAIFASAPLYGIVRWLIPTDLPYSFSLMFILPALVMLPVAIFYRPQDVELAE